MKIRTLFLRAFGPFTDATLDFSGPANLHLVFGANEAGKSSALRAITDLRYGIPAQSRDNFVHEFKSMLVAGAFEDVAGRVVGLARRKGNKDTLMVADPDSGEPVTGVAVPADRVLALTGGVMREQFETMYGLDPERLRRGGRQLIHGEGDLGAALFEASTGSANIKAMLLTLQADAKKYYAGRSQSAVLNEALSQLETARQAYKQAVTRPEQWKVLHRAHAEAAARLAEVRAALDATRRRLAVLAELRAVEPLLRQWDQASAASAALALDVELPQDARERRLAAQQMQLQAEQALAEAGEAMLASERECATLKFEPLVLEHAGAVERLVADLAAARRGREAHVRMEAATVAQGEQLVLRARRMLGGAGPFESLEALYAQAPSEADQTGIDHLLAELQRLAQELQHAQLQLGAARKRSEQLRRTAPVHPDPAGHQALLRALVQAHALGDTHRQQTDLQKAMATETRKRDQGLKDLGLASVEQLDNLLWLPGAEIDAHERQRADIAGRLALLAARADKTRLELAAEQQQRQMLAAQGEVVTAGTLAQARAVRDADWRQVRAVYIDRTQGADVGASAHPPLPEAFELAVSETDRQADLLREGAKRAAEVAVCELRIQHLSQDLDAVQSDCARQEQALQALDTAWAVRVSQSGLPVRPPAALREWQALRTSVREVQERLADHAHAHGLFLAQTASATNALAAALGGVGRAPPGDMNDLSLLRDLATATDKDLTVAIDAATRWSADMADAEHQIAESGRNEAALSSDLAHCRAALDARCRSLLLAPGVPAEAIKARLAEFLRWAKDVDAHSEHLQQVQAAGASAQLLVDDAAALALRLGERVPGAVDDWVDQLGQRLADARAAAINKEALERSAASAKQRTQRAHAERDAATRLLDDLVATARVADVSELQEAETRSEARRLADARLVDLTRQLAQASPKDAAQLRAELAGLDSVAIDSEKERCAADIDGLSADERASLVAEEAARSALAAVDTSDAAAQAREAMEAAITRYRSGVRPWAQLKLAEALLREALRRHRDKAQGPVLALASTYFRRMTAGRFERLLVEDSDEGKDPVLMAQPAHGRAVGIAGLSEGTGDQLHLALRLAALEVQRQPDRVMPLVLDDVFITSDDARSAHILQALEQFSAQVQVLVFTHHEHLVDIATRSVAPAALKVHRLAEGPGLTTPARVQ